MQIDSRPYELALMRGIFEPEQARDMVRVCNHRLFSDDGVKSMWHAFLKLHFAREPITKDTILMEMLHAGSVEDVQAQRLIEEVSALPRPVSIPKLAEGVGTLRGRVLLEELREFLDKPEAKKDGMLGAISKINEFTASLHAFSTKKPETLLETINRVMERTEPAKVWTPGLGRLDNYWKIRKPSFTVIGADSGSGKTALMVNIALNIARTGTHVGVISLEMTKEEVVFRAGAILAGIDNSRFEDNILSDVEMAQIRYAVAQNADLLERIKTIDDSMIAVEQLHGKYNELIQMGCEVVMGDYLQKVTMLAKNNGKTDQATAASEMITAITKSTGVASIWLSVLNEESSAFSQTNGKKRKGLNNLKNARQIGHDASMVVIMTMMEGSSPEDAQKYIVVESVKNRKGSWFCKPLLFDGPTQRFIDDGREVGLQ